MKQLSQWFTDSTPYDLTSYVPRPLPLTGMTRIDGLFVPFLQTRFRVLLSKGPTKTNANVFSKVKNTLASAFRVASPAMALA